MYSNYFLYNIRRIRKYLSRRSTETLIHAFVSSRIDYCNSLLYGLSTYQLNKLQRAQNAAARLIFQKSKYYHVRPLLYNLHWLPVKFRIDFKILLLTYKAINGLAPFYLQELITGAQQARAPVLKCRWSVFYIVRDISRARCFWEWSLAHRNLIRHFVKHEDSEEKDYSFWHVPQPLRCTSLWAKI